MPYFYVEHHKNRWQPENCYCNHVMYICYFYFLGLIFRIIKIYGFLKNILVYYYKWRKKIKKHVLYFQYVSIYAAYLYDSVKLYAWALDKLLRQEPSPLTDEQIYEVASNGTKIIETIIQNRTYKSEY